MKRDVGQYVSYLLVVILTLFLVSKCSEVSDLRSDVAKIENYKDTVKFYKSKNGSLIAYNDAITIEKKALQKVKDSLFSVIDDMKMNPNVVVRWKTRVDVDTQFIPFETKIPCEEEFKADFKYDDKWLTIDGTVMNTGVSLNNISLENDILFVVGEKKNGFFKKDEYVVAIKSENPYFQTEGVQSYTIKPKERFHDKLWFKALLFVAGVGTGLAL
jgi:hypothetical protein